MNLKDIAEKLAVPMITYYKGDHTCVSCIYETYFVDEKPCVDCTGDNNWICKWEFGWETDNNKERRILAQAYLDLISSNITIRK